MFEIAEARAAVFFFNRDAVQPECADFRPELARKFVGFVDIGGTRRDFVACEILDGFAKRIRGLAEIEVEGPIRVWDHGRASPGRAWLLMCTKPYSAKTRLSRHKALQTRHASRGRMVEAGCRKLSLARACATG